MNQQEREEEGHKALNNKIKPMNQQKLLAYILLFVMYL